MPKHFHIDPQFSPSLLESNLAVHDGIGRQIHVVRRNTQASSGVGERNQSVEH